jgi:hypothetical protein
MTAQIAGDVLSQLGAHIPSLAVLAYVVTQFLKYMQEQRKDYVDKMTGLHAEHLQARQDTKEVLNKLSDSMDRLTDAVRKKV